MTMPGKVQFDFPSAPAQTGRREQVSETRVEQVLSREESTLGKPNPYAVTNDRHGEA